MELNNLKIDDDLEEYLSSKDDKTEFVNKCIREAKKKDKSLIAETKFTHSTFIKSEDPKPVEKAKTDYTYAIIITAILMFAILMLVIILPKTESKSPSELSLADSSMVSSITEEGEPAAARKAETVKQWSLSSEKDAMTSATNRWAELTSDNTVSLSAPYDDTNATITIRYMKQYGYDAIVRIESGQIFGNEYEGNNYLLVRFDAGSPIKYWFDEPSDGSSNSVFIRRHSDFTSRCKKAKTIKIEIPLYQEGRPVFEFSVDKPLVWK